MMNETGDIALAVQGWLARLTAKDGPALAQSDLPRAPIPALAALAAEAMARDKRLLIAVPDDNALPAISNALDMGLRPLCLVLPGADYAIRIALRATVSLLKSRLARDDASGPAWTRQRALLERESALWQQAQTWTQRGLDRDAWPRDLGKLFPVHILPLSIARSFDACADWVVIADPSRMREDVRRIWPGAVRTLLLEGDAIAPGRAALATVDADAQLRMELEVLTQELSELELELATAQAELAAFAERYATLVAGRIAELDRLQAQLAARRAELEPENPKAKTEAEQAYQKAEQSQREHARFSEKAKPQSQEAPSFNPTKDLKKLYRNVAQKIHPDRARDDEERAWRNQLMAEANRAYRAGDQTALREILSLWREGERRVPQASASADKKANSALAAQVVGVRRRVAEIGSELNRLYGSRLYELFAAANVARRQGRDLLQEMADRLDLQIDATNADLDGTLPNIPKAQPTNG